MSLLLYHINVNNSYILLVLRRQRQCYNKVPRIRGIRGGQRLIYSEKNWNDLVKNNDNDNDERKCNDIDEKYEENYDESEWVEDGGNLTSYSYSGLDPETTDCWRD